MVGWRERERGWRGRVVVGWRERERGGGVW